jgi:hypothetical protein
LASHRNTIFFRLRPDSYKKILCYKMHYFALESSRKADEILLLEEDDDDAMLFDMIVEGLEEEEERDGRRRRERLEKSRELNDPNIRKYPNT